MTTFRACVYRAWAAVGLTLLASFVQPVSAQTKKAYDEARRKMVDLYIEAEGITHEGILDAMRSTPRHEFCEASERKNAYFDMALPIGEAQTISPPFIVAYMTQELDPQPTDVVLEIGTGSGYQAAILSPLVSEVYTIEIVEPLGKRAASVLKRLGYKNVFPKIGDGYQGWEEHAPFDKIIVTCSPENVPQKLIDQLKDGGKMIVPLGERFQQTLYSMRKQDGKLVQEALRPTLFVPMTGAAEKLRQVQPDPLHPSLVNGGFEEARPEVTESIPDGWHYLRQMKWAEDTDAPEGQRYVKFTNSNPGQTSQAIQAFAVDGRKVPLLDVSLRVRGKDVALGRNKKFDIPSFVVRFYDDKRKTIQEDGIGPFRGTFDWREETKQISVPREAREAIIHVGLLGGLGELDIDQVSVAAGEKKKRK